MLIIKIADGWIGQGPRGLYHKALRVRILRVCKWG